MNMYRYPYLSKQTQSTSPPPEQIIHPKADFCLLLCVLYSGLIVTVTQNDMISGLM